MKISNQRGFLTFSKSSIWLIVDTL